MCSPNGYSPIRQLDNDGALYGAQVEFTYVQLDSTRKFITIKKRIDSFHMCKYLNAKLKREKK